MSKRFYLFVPVAFLCVLMTNRLWSQNSTPPPADPEETDIFHNLHFRNLGPAVAGGRVTSVVGVPGNPDLYYAGGAAGGVFKSTNGGITWKAVFEHEATASVGSIALAPTNPNLVWVGTGEANVRNDVIDGAGIYLSPDAGASWKCMGLQNAGQISRVLIDPHNANIVFAGVLGNAWGPNEDRGVFRTMDGGKTWKKVLFVDDTTGVSDLTMQADNPQVLYAAMWHFRRYPWTLEDGGASSGIYRSTDGGENWKKLSEGLPAGPLGRIAIASAPSNPSHLYALVAAKKGLLWQSFDMGNHWSEVSDNHALDVRPFYFSRMVVSPVDENKIYFLSFEMMESDDGGKTAHQADHGVHPDHHTLWIDPQNPSRMIQGNDGGVFLSMDAAKSWRFVDSLPVEQLYQVAIDSQVPYTVCGGLQDNSAWCGPSSNPGRSSVTNADWYSVVGGDGEYAVPALSDSNVIYTDAQNGFIERLDKRNHLSHFVRPYVQSVENTPPANLKYRFNWTSPIAVSSKDANEVYLGGNVVFKSTNGGQSWAPISGDLTRNDKSKQVISGAPVHHDISGAESYDTILSITLAPTDRKVIWVGTDDGCVQVTRDAGKSWSRVDPNIPGAPQWTRVYQIGVSPFDAGTAYVSFDAHELADRHSYVFKTGDYGQTWHRLTNGLPDAPVVVVREDPNLRDFLIAGSERGLYYSRDAGGHWSQFKAHFPTTPVWDLKFVKERHDLVVATHGRGFFVFDNLRPLEELSAEIQANDFHLFSASDGILLHHWTLDENNPVPFSAPNAPRGAVIDYLLKAKLEASPEQKQAHQTPAKIIVTDDKGNVVATHYGPSNAGINRYVWDMRYQGARRLDSGIPTGPLEPGELEEVRFFTTGPAVLPGKYEVAVTVNGKTQKAAVAVRPDPNLNINAENFRNQTEAALTLRNEMIALNNMIERIDTMDRQIAELKKSLSSETSETQKYASVLHQSDELRAKLKSAKDSVYDPNIQHDVEEDDIHQLTALHANVEGLAGELASAYDEPPNDLLRQHMDNLSVQVRQRLSAFNDLLKTDVANFNKAAYASGASTLFAGEPIAVTPAPKLP
jgi:photosystem II stability/assembly factor-like uncharacterized protein